MSCHHLLLAFFGLLLLYPGVESRLITLHEEVLIGWQGEVAKTEFLYDPLFTRNLSDVPKEIPLPASKGWIEHVSWEPRAFIWHNFITDEEARHIINLAVPQMKRSTVVGAGGKSVEDNYRTSYGTFLRRYQDAVVERVENKVAAWTKIPVEHQEDIQVLRYGIGQYYKPHADTLRDEQAGARVATVLVYLNEPEEGGETSFPQSTWVNPTLLDQYGSTFSQCAKGQVGIRPKRGDALLFWSINPDGQSEDMHAMHQGCPVIKGAKWTLTKWIHAKPFRGYEMDTVIRSKGYVPKHVDPGFCEDTSPYCSSMVERDGCNLNSETLVVGVSAPGSCRLSCGKCKLCDEGDVACYNSNREEVGYLVHNPEEIK